MLTTEEDARTKVCHVSLTGVIPAQTCVASGCMAWRLGAPLIEHRALPAPGLTLDEDKMRAEGWRKVRFFNHAVGVEDTRWERETAKRGYCGLAGRPEEQR